MSGAYYFCELLVNLPASVGQPVNATDSQPLDPLSDDFVTHLAARGAAHEFDQRGFTDLLLYNPDRHRPDFYGDEAYLPIAVDRKSTRLNSSHVAISYA